MNKETAQEEFGDEPEEAFDDVTPDDIAMAAMQGLLAQPNMKADVAAITAWSICVPAYYKGREQWLKIMAGAQQMAEWVKNNPTVVTGVEDKPKA